MFQVAIYGKGGIGKSTMAANISFSLASRGKKVMQVGCDPKHDSTRLLLGGRAQTTVLDYVRSTPVFRRKLEDVVETGSGGVICAEAGGPEPGIGCAGRGILTTFDTLKKLGADSMDVDVKIYDVLGDVVCGGFAVPLRGEYADAVILVTSGEFMSMYAANNIMKGLSNFDTGKPRVLGMILNSRGVDGEEESVRRFAAAAGIPAIAVIPRDDAFRDAEANGHTVREMHPESEISKRVDEIASMIADAADGKRGLFYPKPLDDLQLSDLAAGREIRPGTGAPADRIQCPGCGRRTTIRDTRIMNSCAAFGAMSAFLRITDFTVVLHGPRSCMYLMDMSHEGSSLHLHSRGLYDFPPRHNLVCTMMDDSVSIFGGVKMLEECLEKTLAGGADKVAVVTTCMPGIIGDDTARVVEKASAAHPEAMVVHMPTDGDVAGEYGDGVKMAVESILGMIDTSVDPEEGLVNLIGTSFFDIHSRRYADEVDRMLAVFGEKVNCRFLDEMMYDTLVNYCRASVDILVSDVPSNRELMGMIIEHTGRKPFQAPLPVGMREYAEWMRLMGARTGRSEDAEREIAAARKEYEECVKTRRRRFEGKKAIVISRMNRSSDWLMDLLLDLGVEIVRLGCFPSPRKDGTDALSRYIGMLTENYSIDMLEDDMDRLSPDLLICDLIYPVRNGCRFARIGKAGIGLRGVLDYAEYLENILRLPATDGWREAVR